MTTQHFEYTASTLRAAGYTPEEVKIKLDEQKERQEIFKRLEEKKDKLTKEDFEKLGFSKENVALELKVQAKRIKHRKELADKVKEDVAEQYANSAKGRFEEFNKKSLFEHAAGKVGVHKKHLDAAKEFNKKSLLHHGFHALKGTKRKQEALDAEHAAQAAEAERIHREELAEAE